MFSGIVEAKEQIVEWYSLSETYHLKVARPLFFDDIKIGDSICVNGVCLTIESFNDKILSFTVGPETLKITNWNKNLKINSYVNLERSLKFGDRVHGHMVTGHVDETALVKNIFDNTSTREIVVELTNVSPYIWRKGSIAINGVSLTVNSVNSQTVSVCIVPETLRKTNLNELKVLDRVNIEYDYLAKAYLSNNKGDTFALNK